MNKSKLNFLSSYRFILTKIDMLEERLANLDDRLYQPKGQIITDMPKGGERLDPLDLVYKKTEVHDELNQRLQEAIETKRKIERAIDNVEDNRYQVILQLKYIENYSLSDIADRMCYSYQHMTKLHRRAVSNISVE